MRKFSTIFLLAGLVAAGFTSCKKGEHLDKIVPTPEASRFNAATLNGKYFITSTPVGMTYKIPVSISTNSSADRTLQLTYTSPSGAAQGVQYNAPTSLTIEGGKLLDTLVINGLVAGYPGSARRDTLYVRISSPDTVFGKGTFTVIMQKYCDVILANLSGNYANTREYNASGAVVWGPYTTAVGTLTSTGATTAEADIQNIYDYGGQVRAKFDWTDPANFKLTIAEQYTGINLVSGGVTYQLWLRTTNASASAFSSCENNITIWIDAIAKNPTTGATVGFFDSNYKIILAR